jgi:hypothetical protein
MIGLQRKAVFIDRNSGGRKFRGIVEKADIRVVLHDELFKITTADHVWLKRIGALGYMMVTGDIAIERSYIFLSDLRRSLAQVFILCDLNHATPEGRAQCIISAYPEMLRLVHSHSGPRLWKLRSSSDGILPIDFRHNRGILKKYGRVTT